MLIIAHYFTVVLLQLLFPGDEYVLEEVNPERRSKSEPAYLTGKLRKQLSNTFLKAIGKMDATSPDPTPVDPSGNQRGNREDKEDLSHIMNGNGVLHDQEMDEGCTCNDTVRQSLELQESLEEEDEEEEDEEDEEDKEEEDTFVELPAVTKPLENIFSQTAQKSKKEENSRGRSNSLFKILGRRQKLIEEASEATGEVRTCQDSIHVRSKPPRQNNNQLCFRSPL